MPSFQIFVQGVKEKVSILDRRDQILAAVLLPFFIVAAMGFAVVIHEVLLEFLPDAAASISAVIFLSGIVLVIAVVVASFLWVNTGGFGIFAN